MNDSGRAPARLGEAPDLGEDVAGRGTRRVEALRLGRADRERGGVLGDAGELDTDRIVGQLADDAGAREDRGERLARARSSKARGDEPGAVVRPSPGRARGRRRTPRGRRRSEADSSTVGATPSGGTSPLDSETTRRAPSEPALGEAGERLASLVDGTARKT